MTADLAQRLRAEAANFAVSWHAEPLLREAADAIEQLTIYNSTNREIADRAERAEARLAAADKKHYADLVETNREWIAETEVVSQRLAAAERVISAARPISAMNNGLIRYSGPQMSELFDLLSAALDGYEKAYLSEQSAPTAQNAHLSKRTALNKSGVAQMTERQPDKGDQSVGSRHGPADLNFAQPCSKPVDGGRCAMPAGHDGTCGGLALRSENLNKGDRS